jgi:DNA-directed RNA polymerase subunit RPC12/RpoP
VSENIREFNSSARAATYTDAEWQADFLAIFAKRAPPPPCARCGRTGFFGPRRAANDRRYWLCKFCGFSASVGGGPVQCRATVHRCTQWPTVAGAPYVWWVQPDETRYECPYCGTVVEVASATVKRPVEDPSHPWHGVPEKATFAQAAAFWVRQGRARVYL